MCTLLYNLFSTVPTLHIEPAVLQKVLSMKMEIRVSMNSSKYILYHISVFVYIFIAINNGIFFIFPFL